MNEKKPVTAATLTRAKQRGEKTVWLTAYDAASAEIAEAAGIDVLLVGDSLGMAVLGYDTTIPVTLEQMIHHTAAVVRGRTHAWVVCDLPFGSYQGSPEQAFDTAVRVLQQTGCDAVKLEGGTHMAETIRFLAERGIAVVAHIGLTPQSVKRFGSYRKRGKDDAEHAGLIADAQAVADAGAVAVVLENIPAGLAAEITADRIHPHRRHRRRYRLRRTGAGVERPAGHLRIEPALRSGLCAAARAHARGHRPLGRRRQIRGLPEVKKGFSADLGGVFSA